MAYKNSEGYNDPTAGEAIGEVTKEERREKHKKEHNTTLRNIRAMLNVTDSDTKNADKSRKER